MRTPVAPAVEKTLADAPWLDRPRRPKSFSHKELAVLVYKTRAPSKAQLSATRRATSRLVREGRITRRRSASGVLVERLTTDREVRVRQQHLAISQHEISDAIVAHLVAQGNSGQALTEEQRKAMMRNGWREIREISEQMLRIVECLKCHELSRKAAPTT